MVVLIAAEFSADLAPVGIAVIAFVAAVYAAWTKDRNNPMAQTVTAANDTTSQLQAFIAPLQVRVTALEVRVATQDAHILILQQQIRALGHEPFPFPPHQGGTP